MKSFQTDPTVPELGFVLDSMDCGALQFEEFMEWVYLVIKERDELSTFMYDVASATNRREAEDAIDFFPISNVTDIEGDALYGISVKRGIGTSKTAPDLAVRSNETALKALADNPHIEQRFRDTFPFIDF